MAYRNLFIGLLIAALPAFAAEPSRLTPEASALIAPALAAFKTIDADYAALPPTTDVAQQLIRMGRRDQDTRIAYSKIDFAKLTGEQRTLAFDAVYAEIDRRDAEHQKALVDLLPAEGWFAKSKYGAEAAEAAWLILQHAVRLKPELLRTVKPAMDGMLAAHEVDRPSYARLDDRLAMMDGRFQTYGTQMVCHMSRWVAYPIGDRNAVDQRRKEMEITETVTEMLTAMASRTCPSEWTGKLPPGAKLGEP
ncbi:MAG: hypothetical protein LCH56_14500 [Proteobacteria bacterium]|nr:hypothetical protein [Pseudomonadota bacterium]